MPRDYHRYCEWCGKAFTTRHKRQRFCDNRCKSESHHHRYDLRQDARVYEAMQEFMREREHRER